MEQDMDTTI